MDKLDCLKLTTEFGAILADPVLATNVSVKVLLRAIHPQPRTWITLNW